MTLRSPRGSVGVDALGPGQRLDQQLAGHDQRQRCEVLGQRRCPAGVDRHAAAKPASPPDAVDVRRPRSVQRRAPAPSCPASTGPSAGGHEQRRRVGVDDGDRPVQEVGVRQADRRDVAGLLELERRARAPSMRRSRGRETTMPVDVGQPRAASRLGGGRASPSSRVDGRGAPGPGRSSSPLGARPERRARGRRGRPAGSCRSWWRAPPPPRPPA